MAIPNELIRDDSPLGVDGFRLEKHPDSANRLPETRHLTVKASCGYSHVLNVFGVNAVNDHYNFVVAQPLFYIRPNN